MTSDDLTKTQTKPTQSGPIVQKQRDRAQKSDDDNVCDTNARKSQVRVAPDLGTDEEIHNCQVLEKEY